MALNKNIKAETLLNGTDLKLIDESEYNITNPKNLFINRHVIITYNDGTFIEREFPYTNVDNNVKDEIIYSNIFTKDSIISIEISFIYIDEETPTEVLTFNYLSIIFSLKCRSNLANSICGCDDCNNELTLLTKLDNLLSSAEYASIFGEAQKSQKFLDSCNDICQSIKNKNCKDC